MGKQMRVDAAKLYSTPTWRIAARRMSNMRNGTGQDMNRTQGEEPYECPLEQSTFTQIPKC